MLLQSRELAFWTAAGTLAISLCGCGNYEDYDAVEAPSANKESQRADAAPATQRASNEPEQARPAPSSQRTTTQPKQQNTGPAAQNPSSPVAKSARKTPTPEIQRMIDLGAEVMGLGANRYAKYTNEDLPNLYFRRPGKFTDEHAKLLLEFPNLKELDLSGQAISLGTILAVAQLKELRKLNLSSTAIDNNYLSHLAELPNLEMLFIENVDVTDDAVMHLARCKALKRLFVQDTPGITQAGIDKLKESNPTVGVSGLGELLRRRR